MMHIIEFFERLMNSGWAWALVHDIPLVYIY